MKNAKISTLQKIKKNRFITSFKRYWPLFKSLQTFLLLITGIAGFVSVKQPIGGILTVLSLTGSLFLSISGSTILNMWFDRDIDAKMKRTCWRPLPSKLIKPKDALVLGLLLSTLGVSWALIINSLFGLIVFAGLFFDVVIYTVWLKRLTPWSIIWGGISGGMPVLAGRALAIGSIDWVGILLALAILFWIPTHILTFSIRHQSDYEIAGIPIFPTKYGVKTTQRIIAFSSILSILFMIIACLGIGLTTSFLWLFYLLSAGLVTLACCCLLVPSEKLNFRLFKFASVYMLGSMLIIVSQFFL